MSESDADPNSESLDPTPERGDAESARTAAAPPTATPQRSKTRSRLAQLLVVALATVGILFGAVWWEDRPLRVIRDRLDRGQPELALAEVNFFLDKHPDDHRALAFKAWALADTGKTLEAIELFERILPENSTEMYVLSKAYTKIAQWSRALPLLVQVVLAEPTNPAPLQDLIGCQFQMGAYSQGLASAEKLAKLPGQQARGLSWQAFFYDSIEERTRAIEAFARTLEVSPDAKDLPVPAGEFLLRYGQALLADRQNVEARQRLEQSVAIEPSAGALAALARIQDEAEDTEGAEKNYRRALDLDPAHPEACEALAQRAFDAGEYETAQRRLVPLAMLPIPRVKTARILTAIFEQTGNDEEARRWRGRLKQLEARQKVDEAVKRLVNRAPESLWAGVVRAHGFASQGNWAQAQSMLESFREQAPNEPFIQDLCDAVAQHGPLPSLERLPLEQF